MAKEIKNDFVVTARKWRPLKFDDVIGQDHITQTLRNAIRGDRIHHAYIFSGPRGVGKTTTARILARAVNCLNPQDAEPCNECKSCISVLENQSLDVIEIDGASNNSVDDVRRLRENAKFSPSLGKYKMYIIDEVHMLSTSAFNALLKILEEPPAHLLFVFATTESHKVPATIISRCQRFDFRRIEIDKITAHLKFIADNEDINIDEQSLITIAKKGDGSMRDAQSIFDQVVAFCGKEITYTKMADALNLIDEEFFFRISDAAEQKDLEAMFTITREVMEKGYDLQECIIGAQEHFRNLLTVKVTGNTELIESSRDILEKYDKSAEKFSKADLLRIMNLLNRADQSLRFSPQPRIKFELALIRIASMDKAVEISELLEELKNFKGGDGAAAPKAPANEKKTPDLMEEFPTEQIKPQQVKESAHEKADIAPEDAPSEWDNFIKQYGTAEKGLAGLATCKAEFFDNEIVIICGEPFIHGILKESSSKVGNAVKNFFGSKYKFKISLEEKESGVGKKKPAAAKKSAKSADNKDIDFETSENQSETKDASTKDMHPADKAVVELFGAKEINS